MHSEELVLYLTERCQLDCVMCDALLEPAAREKDMPLELLERIFSQFTPVNVTLFGGEPTLHPRFTDVLAFLKKRVSYLYLTTNGIRVPQYADAISECIDTVAVSLDSHEPSVHDQIRDKKGAWQDAVRGIDCLVQRRRNIVRCNCVITKHNYRTLSALCEWAKERGLDLLSFNFPREHPQTLPKSESRYQRVLKSGYGEMDPGILGAEVEKILEYDFVMVNGPRGRKDITEFLLGRSIPAPGGCQAFNTLTLYPNGQVNLCSDFPETVIGSIDENGFLNALGNLRWAERKKSTNFRQCLSCLKRFQAYGPGVEKWRVLLAERYPRIERHLRIH